MRGCRKDRFAALDRDEDHPRRRLRAKLRRPHFLEVRRERRDHALAIEKMRHSIARAFCEEIGDGGDKLWKSGAFV